MGNVSRKMDWIVWRSERRGGGRVFGGAVMEEGAGEGLGELVRSRLGGDGDVRGESARLVVGGEVGGCFVSSSPFFVMDSSSKGSSLAGVASSFLEADGCSGRGIVGMTKSLFVI